MPQSIQSTQLAHEIHETIRRIPGATTGRELPWEFAGNEVAMWMGWFSTTDESVPGNTEVNACILNRNRPGMLLSRLLVKPWLHKKEA